MGFLTLLFVVNAISTLLSVIAHLSKVLNQPKCNADNHKALQKLTLFLVYIYQ